MGDFIQKEDVYSHLNMADITDADYMHAKRAGFSNKNLGEYHDLYVQRDTLLLASAANKGQSTVNYHQSLAFDHPNL